MPVAIHTFVAAFIGDDLHEIIAMAVEFIHAEFENIVLAKFDADFARRPFAEFGNCNDFECALNFRLLKQRLAHPFSRAIGHELNI
jgi:hypothetical protein